MQNIHPKVKDFVEKGETNYETDRINKENNAILLLTKNRKIQNIQQNTTSKPSPSFVERRRSRGK